MKKNKGLFAVAGIVGAVGAAFGIKKLKENAEREEILIREADLNAETAENTETEHTCCGGGCCGGSHDEPTENVVTEQDAPQA